MSEDLSIKCFLIVKQSNVYTTRIQYLRRADARTDRQAAGCAADIPYIHTNQDSLTHHSVNSTVILCI